jgi:hypothetical protein
VARHCFLEPAPYPLVVARLRRSHARYEPRLSWQG